MNLAIAYPALTGGASIGMLALLWLAVPVDALEAYCDPPKGLAQPPPQEVYVGIM